MAVAIQTVATAAFGSANAVITKPTGLAVGDLMVAIVGSHGAATPPAGWTTDQMIVATTGDVWFTISVFSKIAASGDVAASDFTFSGSGDASGVMYRITGHLASDPITAIGGAYDAVAPLTNVTASVSLDPVGPDSLVLVGVSISSSSSVTPGTFSEYTIAGPTNPTWTERIDNGTTTSIDTSFAVADGVLASNTTITSITATGTQADPDRGLIAIVVIASSTDASGTAALLQATPVFPAPTGSVTATATAALLVAAPTFPAPTSTVTAQKWTNLAKTAATNVTNTPKV